MKKKFKSILLIDDNAADNRYNQIILEEMNIADKVEIAETGIEALEMLEDSDHPRPDLVLLDINMPKMNGWEFLEAYKKLGAGQDDKNKNVVVILTTSINPEDKARAEGIAGVAEFNTKPLTPDMLNNIFKKYLSQADDEEK
ncbi:MAG: response regulator [Ferruginibacter sp.]